MEYQLALVVIILVLVLSTPPILTILQNTEAQQQWMGGNKCCKPSPYSAQLKPDLREQTIEYIARARREQKPA